MNQELELEKVLWSEEIQLLNEKTVAHPKKTDVIVFYGSSSIRLWDTMATDLSPFPVVNLGFGGSSYFWCDFFFEEIFSPVKPSKVLLYAGDNDLGTGVPENEIIGSVGRLLEKIKIKFGQIPIAIISVKPSPDRRHLEAKMKSLNQKLHKLITEYEKGSFVDIYTSMLNVDGSLRPELYIEDELHINERGYEIWKEVIQKHLTKMK